MSEPQIAAVLAVTLRGYPRAEGEAASLAGIVARVHHLLDVHATAHGGTACPSGFDAGLARFDGVQPALAAAVALIREVEAARGPDGHPHHGLLAAGIDLGAVLVGPDGRVLGVPVARAVRLAIHAEGRGELRVSEAARQGLELPTGLGLSAARPDDRAALGFGFCHVRDYGA